VRILRVLTRPNLGGPTRQAIALWQEHQRLGARTLLVTGTVGPGEVALSPADAGVPQVPWQRALTDADAVGWTVVPGLGRRVRGAGDWLVGRRLRQLMAAWRPDVVHTHTSKAGWLGRRAAAAVGVPVVAHTFHGLVLQDYFGPLGSWWMRHLERGLARRTNLLFAVSESCRDELVAAGIANRERIAIALPAVPLPPLEPRDRVRAAMGLAEESLCAVFVGRFAPVKQVDHFAAAVAAAAPWRGVAFGDGELPSGFAAAVAAAGGRVEARPSEPALAAKLAGFDALVLCSRREGLPLAAVEAFAAGLVVVGYDVPGIRDAIALGGGLLVPPAEGPAGLARALSRIAEDPALRRTAAARGPAVAMGFSPHRLAESLLDAYRNAVR
jgi:glycosyltransferase involved in cell wall biosynthesis